MRKILAALMLATIAGSAVGLRDDMALSRIVVEPADVAAFRASAGDHVSPVTIELRPAAQPAAASGSNRQRLAQVAQARLAQQDRFIASLPARGIRILPAQVDAKQADGSVQTVRYRYTSVLNGFSAWVANSDIARLRALPEVRSVQIEGPLRLTLNRAIDYTLGTHAESVDRRRAVYGDTEEMQPAGSAGHPETPKTTTTDGVEGQNLVMAVIDTGVDWKHPMFGGTGHNTPTPQIPPASKTASTNTKVTYLVNFSAGDPGDDYGHGTFVASNSGGYRVDGNTPPNLGYGVGVTNQGVGPTPSGAVLHGTAPQVTLMGYKTLSAAGTGVNNSTQLGLDDAVSPCVSAVDTAGQCITKPIADVINLSLGGGGSASSASTKAANNAALAGAIVVASAGNSGPGPSTVGAPCMGTLVICVGASLDPGSISGGAVLAPDQVTGETRSAGAAGPLPETGPASEANLPQPGARQNMRLFNAAGGGPIPGGSLSAHYVYANVTPPAAASAAVTNRIALVRGTGAFATIANSVAPLRPAAILIITAVESATAVTVIGGIPTYTIGIEASNYLIDLMLTGDPGDGDDAVHVPNNTISELPLRLTDGIALDVYDPAMAGFSSRGPNSVAGSDYRNIKPDVTAPGAGILAAATPDGNPNASGMGEPSGYIVASGTSFSGPITAGAMALIRQRVRALGFDTIDLADPQYRAKRFDTVTIARALAQNTSTNLRSGLGVPLLDASDGTSIHDLGSGHIDVAAALDAQAIMAVPTRLLGNGVEFDMPTLNPPAGDAGGNIEVLLPTHAFGRIGVANAPGVVTKSARVIVRDITAGGGAGTYDLSWQDDINALAPGVAISFVASNGTTPITSITVPSGGSAEFRMKIAVDGTAFTTPDTDIAWYATARHAASGRTLRVPFYLRAVAFVSSNLVAAAPVQTAPSGVETAAAAPACGTDTNGDFSVNFTYAIPTGGDLPIGFRIQEGSGAATAVFEDAADEQLVLGENSSWSGSPQWQSAVSPGSGNPAYWVPDTAEQNESLTMIEPIVLPAGGTLTFDTFQDTEDTFDFAIVELVIDGVTVELGKFSGLFDGTRSFDLSAFAGRSAKVQFRLTSDANTGFTGWFIENIRITRDDFATIGETGPEATTFDVPRRGAGTRYYRIAGLFADVEGSVAGPSSNLECVTVNVPNLAPVANAGVDFAVDEGATALLSGAGSSDPENGVLTYAWSHTAPGVTLNNANTATPSFTAPAVTVDTPITFELRVTDGGGLSHTDTATVTVRNVEDPVDPDPDPTPVTPTTTLGNNQVGALAPLSLALLCLLALRRRRPSLRL